MAGTASADLKREVRTYVLAMPTPCGLLVGCTPVDGVPILHGGAEGAFRLPPPSSAILRRWIAQMVRPSVIWVAVLVLLFPPLTAVDPPAPWPLSLLRQAFQ